MTSHDHIVIGGGIVGLSTALALARQGARTVLLESDSVASGASGGPGMRGVRANARHPAEMELAAAATALWPQLDEDLGSPTGFERRGGMELFERNAVAADGGLDRLLTRVRLQNERGIASELVERDALVDALADLDESVSHGIHVASDGVAPPQQATEAHRDAALRAGVDIRTNSTALRLTEDAESVIVETADGPIRADTASVCANTGTRALLRHSFGVELAVWDVAFHAFFIEPESPWHLPLLIGHDSVPLAAKTVRGGLLQVSGFLTAPWDETLGRSAPAPEMGPRALDRFRSVFPSFGTARITGVEARRESCAPDRLQTIDRVPGTSRTWVAAGWSGHGFATAPAVGRALASWVETGERPPVLRHFGWHRW